MKDQAERLRYRIQQSQGARKARTIAVVSGKGGVGKTNVTINFALMLCEQHQQVLIIDMDIGMGNIDVLLGRTSKYAFPDLFHKDIPIRDMIELGPNSLSYIAGGSGLTSIFQMDARKFERFETAFESLLDQYDYILFDMGAGVNPDSLGLISSADEAFVVTTPEPTSITDAYAMMKHVIRHNPDLPISIMVNRSFQKQRDSTYMRLHTVVKNFLHKDVSLIGTIPDDRQVMKAVTRQTPFVLSAPNSQASAAIHEAATNYLKRRQGEPTEAKSSTFLSKLKRMVFERSL
ncbi:MinD/ParA family protein [Halobacillus fulvus]|nr:MinD/ParA family protein [Halobacillus fulvus]